MHFISAVACNTPPFSNCTSLLPIRLSWIRCCCSARLLMRVPFKQRTHSCSGQLRITTIGHEWDLSIHVGNVHERFIPFYFSWEQRLNTIFVVVFPTVKAAALDNIMLNAAHFAATEARMLNKPLNQVVVRQNWAHLTRCTIGALPFRLICFHWF